MARSVVWSRQLPPPATSRSKAASRYVMGAFTLAATSLNSFTSMKTPARTPAPGWLVDGGDSFTAAWAGLGTKRALGAGGEEGRDPTTSPSSPAPRVEAAGPSPEAPAPPPWGMAMARLPAPAATDPPGTPVVPGAAGASGREVHISWMGATRCCTSVRRHRIRMEIQSCHGSKYQQ